MDCDRATALVSARMDREIQPEDRALLDAHLLDCATCRATADAFRLQDADLQLILPPCDPSAAAVAKQVLDHLRAAPAAATTPGAQLGTSPPPVRWRWSRVAALAAALAGLAILLYSLPRSPLPGPPKGPSDAGHGGKQAPLPGDAPGLDRLIPRPRPPVLAAKPLKVGETLRTGPRERRRVGLPDGSVLYVNQNSTVKLDHPRILELSRGEVFVEVTPSSKKLGAIPFKVQTAQRTISARGTRFAVRAGAAGPGVVVTQGSVHVSGLDTPLSAGQEFVPETGKPVSAPRASHVLDWTRELMAAAESPLVPASKFAGGALVVIDPNRDQASLSLRKYHIDVHIEDGFARTTIDHTYFNHNEWRMEGTFYFPVPPDASLSRLAMYVDGNLMDGGMAERYYARDVFERIVAGQRDPALLEWMDGNTFKMRVFPLEPRQEKRIILSYTQKLPDLYGQAQYRFPAGHSLEAVRDWSFHARVKNGGAWGWSSRSHVLKASKDGPDLLLDGAQKNVKADRDVVVDLHDPRQSGPVQEVARFSSADQDGARYLMVRYRPVLPAREGRPRRDWVFLFESSGERDPLLARTQVEIIRWVLANAEHGDTFAILTAGTRAQALADKLQPVTPENVQATLAALDQTHLIGALDLGKALEAAEPFLNAAKNPWLVHVGSGKAGMGERRPEVLAQRVPAYCHYVGVAVGSRWSRRFMRLASERTDGYFTRINPDEPIAWRVFDMVATLNTPRLLNVRVVDPDKHAVFLPYANSVAQGEELCAATRLEKRAGGLDPLVPKSLLIAGEIHGQKFRRTVAVKEIAPHADYLPRTWAKLEIHRLLTEDSPKNRDRIITLSKAMYVMTPYTSLLVLENEAMYKQFKVDRGRKDHWAMYPCPRKIPVPAKNDKPQELKVRKPSAEEVLQTILVRRPPRILKRDRKWRDRENLWDSQTALEIYAGTNDLRELSPREAGSEQVTVPVERSHVPFPDEPPIHFPPAAQWRELTRIRRNLQFQESGGGTPDIQGEVGDSFAQSMDPVILRWIRALREKLSEEITLPKGFDANTPLKDALEYLTDRFDLTIILDNRAFEEESPKRRDNVENTPIKLPKMSNVALGTVLRLLVSQIPPNGGAVLIRRDFIEITTQREKQKQNLLSVYPIGDITQKPSRGGHFSTKGSFIVFETHPADGSKWPSHGWKHRTHSTFRIEEDMISFLQLPAMAGSQDGDSSSPFSALWGFSAGLEQPTWIESADVPLTNPTGYESIGDTLDSLYVNDAEEGQSLLYRRPSFSKDEAVFTDLVAFAPGMNTTRADVLAILEAETETGPWNRPGRIDLAARRLINRARAASWQKVALAQPGGFRIILDGAGRFIYDRLLATGLREQVVCDGTTLWHLYPDLGLGAGRRFSRFHLADFARLVPWVLPAAEDLARGADLRCVGPRTVAVLPHDRQQGRVFAGGRPRPAQVQLVFAEDGRLVQRQWVEISSEKILFREFYGADGRVRLVDARGRVAAERPFRVSPATKPNLVPDVKNLVVLPLPWRTHEQISQTRLGEDDRPSPEQIAKGDPLALLAAAFAVHDGRTLMKIFHQRFRRRALRHLGFCTLLAAGGADLDQELKNASLVPFELQMGFLGTLPPAGPLPALTTLFHRPDEPLAQYLAAVTSRKRSGPIALRGTSPWHRFLQRLMDLRVLYHRHQKGLSATEFQKEIRKIQNGSRDALAWAALGLLDDRSGTDGDNRRVLGETYRQFEKVPGLPYEARYEYARSLVDRRRPEACRKFQELYAQTLKQGHFPRIDRDFRRALRGDGNQAGQGPDAWESLMRQTAARQVKEKHRPAVVALAWQCWQLGDLDLAGRLLTTALDRITGDPDRLRTTLVAIEYLYHTNQFQKADQLLRPLLRDKKLARQPSLWRLGVVLAMERRQPARIIECLEQALDTTFQDLPEVIDVEQVRSDYTLLLNQYLQLTDALAAVKKAPPKDLAARVIRAADRWRVLDPDNPVTCPLAAQVLYKLGARELAWDYLNTPLGIFPPDAEMWLELARALTGREDFALADLAYEQASQAEPDNPGILWDRAKNLERAGRKKDARKVYAQLAVGKWEARFQWMQEEARRQVKGR
jgi:tetratricopeptide (TPR) repeat protein